MADVVDVLITRGSAWSASRKSEPQYRLDLGRWLALRGSDPTLIPLESIPGRNPMTGEAMTVATPHSAAWAHPRGMLARFVWRDGELEATAVDALTVAKATEIAQVLQAHVFEGID